MRGWGTTSGRGSCVLGGILHLAATLCVAFVATLTVEAPARAERAPLETILQDDAQLLHGDDRQVQEAMATIHDLGADRVRITAGWSVLTRVADRKEPPLFDATDPAAYEQERWRHLDRAVRVAQAQGLRVMLDVAFWAPLWAAADAEAGRARTSIDPSAFKDFAVAVARRFSGTFTPPAATAIGATPQLRPRDGRLLDMIFRPLRSAGDVLRAQSAPPPPPLPAGPLPRVDMLTLWNEPNHPGFLRPQWRRGRGGWVPASPGVYRRMVEAAYPAVKAARPDVKVLVGATSALGDHGNRGVDGVPPLRFIREMACVDRALRARRDGACRRFRRLPGDGWSHHPYSLAVPPGRQSLKPDDARIGDLERLTSLLRRLAARRRVAPALRKVYVTEYGYETRRGSPGFRFGARAQATFLTWAEYLAWRNPDVRTFAQFLLRDLPSRGSVRSRKRALGQWESGLLFADGRPKPAAQTFQAGLYVERVNGRRLRMWGRVRGLAAGRARAWVEVRHRGGRWRRMLTRDASTGRAGVPFRVKERRVVHRMGRAAGLGARYRLVVRTLHETNRSVEVAPR